MVSIAINTGVLHRHIHLLSWERLTRPKCQGGMGFRDLKSFNLAMLGKQGWRLMTRPESLCARVLKGRYYHDSEFLDCTRKRRASLTWRAILAGRDVLKKGLIRRIGDGSNTRIWEDRWIPQHFGGKPIVPQEGHVLTRVDQLISESGQWSVRMRCRCLSVALMQMRYYGLRLGDEERMYGPGNRKSMVSTRSNQHISSWTSQDSSFKMRHLWELQVMIHGDASGSLMCHPKLN